MTLVKCRRSLKRISSGYALLNPSRWLTNRVRSAMEKRGCKITSQFHTSVSTLKDVCLAVCVFICVCDRNIAHRRIEVLFLGFECLRHTLKDDTLTFKTTYESRQLKHEKHHAQAWKDKSKVTPYHMKREVRYIKWVRKTKVQHRQCNVLKHQKG